MKKIKEVEETSKIQYIEDILCNKCGMSCKGEIGNFNGLIEYTIFGSYDSTHLVDMSNYTFSLCEKCLCVLFNSFSIPIEVNEESLVD